MKLYVVFILFLHGLIHNRTVGFHNLALNGSAIQSGTYGKFDANRAKDGNKNQNFSAESCSHTALNQSPAWWTLDIGRMAIIHNVIIYYRFDRPDRLNGYYLYVSQSFNVTTPNTGQLCASYDNATVNPDTLQNESCDTVGSYVVIYKEKNGHRDSNPILELCEVEVFGCYLGTYGTNCENSCSPHCKDGTCNIMTGACTCESGFQGKTCSEIEKTTDVEVQCKPNRKMRCRWQRQNTVGKFADLPGDDKKYHNLYQPKMIIKNFTHEDVGSYRCKLFDHPTDQTFDFSETMSLGLIGNKLQLFCSRNDARSFLWVKNDKNLPINTRIVYGHETLTINNVSFDDSGNYQCKLQWSNSDPSTWFNDSKIAVTIYGKPVVVTPDKIHFYLVNTDVEIKCTFTANPAVTGFQWKKDGNNMTFPNVPNDRYIIQGNNLRILRTVLTDGGRYTCIAFNSFGIGNDTVQLVAGGKPEVVTPDKTQYYLENTDTELKCNVTANPAVSSVQWIRDGNSIIIPNHRYSIVRNNLRILSTRLTDGGRYTCEAINALGSASDTVQLVAGGKPVVVTPDKIHYYLVNNNTEIKCTITANPIVTGFQWKKDGKNITFTNDRYRIKRNNLRILQTILSDRGNYTCEAINALGIGSAEVQLLAGDKPSIDVSETKTVAVGSSVTINCNVKSSKPSVKSLVWKRETIGYTLASIDVTKYQTLLHIKNITKADAGRYVCIGYNGYANSTAHTDIEVGENPSVVFPTDVFISKSQTNITLTCILNYVTTNASVFWEKSTDTFRWRRIYTDRQKYFGATLHNPELLVTNVQLEDAQTYKCCVNDKYGNACNTTKLKVLYVNTSTAKIVQRANNTVELKCDAKGGKILTWRHNNGFLNTNRYIGGTIDNPTISMKKLSRADAGYYTCETSYDNVTVVSPLIYLDVLDIPHIVKHNTSVRGVPGDFIDLLCRHESNPKPTSVFWTKNGEKIQLNSTTNKFNGSSLLNPSLTILNADPGDSGTYMCVMTNSIGTGYGENITLIVQDIDQLGNTVSLTVGIIAAVIVAGLVLIAVFVLRRRQSNRQKETSQLNQTNNSNTQYVNVPLATYYNNELYTNSESTSTFTKDSVAPPVIQPEATNQSDSEYYNMSDVTKMVKVEALKQYIDRRQINDELRKEYKNMPYGAKLPTKHAQLKDNMPKNRFKTTFPYDHSRVILEVVDGVDNSDYINANFIDGFRKDKCYIASQGPTKLTLYDHWRMIWQYNVRRIVMLTNLIEGTKAKCELYWPKETRMSCGHFALTLVSEKQRAKYITREIVAENTKTKENRTIMQYHFISWPDHGTPDPLYLVLFYGHVTMDQFKDESGPLLVHCSAGIGRTGTYIALDSLCKEGLATGNVNFVKCVERMRQSRMNMIQTADQYVCLHYTLLEAFAMTNTNIRREQFLQIWHEINYDSPSNNKQRLHEEFMILTKKKSDKDQSNYRAAKSPENIGKNRNHDVVPADGCRVFLVSHTADRSDYINAVQVPSYTKLNGFLVTQLPLPDTKIDFWTMIHDHKSTTIVLLLKDTEEADMVYTQPHDSFKIGRFHLKVVAKESENQHLTTLTLNVSTKNTKPRDVIVYQAVCTGIPDATLLCRLVDLITATVRTSDNPITVVSSDGAKNCGLFCTFANAVSSITMDNSADIFNLSRVIQFKQPEFFANFEEYKRCYEALGVYLESSNVYANL